MRVLGALALRKFELFLPVPQVSIRFPAVLSPRRSEGDGHARHKIFELTPRLPFLLLGNGALGVAAMCNFRARLIESLRLVAPLARRQYAFVASAPAPQQETRAPADDLRHRIRSAFTAE